MINYPKVDDHADDEEYLVDHSIVIYLNGPDGQFIDFCTQGTQVLDIANKVETLISEYKKNKLRNPNV